MSLHKHIRDKNLTLFKELLDSDNVNNLDDYGESPIEVLVRNYSPELNTVSTLMVQQLINTGANVDKIKKYIDLKLNDPETQPIERKFLTMIHKAKVYKPTVLSGVQNGNGNKERKFKPAIGNKKSNYSAQELLQLKNVASKLGLNVVNTNHLALKIINHLQKKKCDNCGSSSI